MFAKTNTGLADPIAAAIPVARLCKGIFDRMVSHRQERRAIHAMSAMSDHMLRDLGIGRSQIARTVRYGRPDFMP